MADSSRSEGKPQGGSLSARRHPKITLQGEVGLGGLWGGGFPGHLRRRETDGAPRGRAKDTFRCRGKLSERQKEGVSLLNTFTIFLSSLTSFMVLGESQPDAGLGLGPVGDHTPDHVLTPPPVTAVSGTLLPEISH